MLWRREGWLRGMCKVCRMEAAMCGRGATAVIVTRYLDGATVDDISRQGHGGLECLGRDMEVSDATFVFNIFHADLEDMNIGNREKSSE